MNKKLIAIALAALPVAAMADVTLYGTMKGSLENDKVDGQASQNKVQDNTSILGFKGSEDLGNGLKTIWQVESRLHLDNGTQSSLGTRQTFVGLDGGNLGTVRLGYVNNILNDNYAVDQWQYDGEVYGSNLPANNSGTNAVSGVNGLAVFTNSGDRLKNAIRYDSATFAGFSGSLVYGFGENKTENSRPDGSSSASDVMGLGLNYTYADVAAHYAFQREKNPMGNSGAALGNNGDNTATKHLFEVDYSANNLFVGAAYQISTGYDWGDDFAADGGTGYTTAGVAVANGGVNPVAAKLKARQAALSVAYTIGAFTPKISYAKGWNLKADSQTIDNSGYRQYILGVDYALSKRTTTGLSYGNLRFDQNTTMAAGLNNGSEVTLKTIALTMAHSF